MQEANGIIQSIGTVLLWVVLGCAIVPMVLFSAFYFLILGAFGMDAPGTPLVIYFSALLMPVLVASAFVGGGWMAIHLWEKQRWKYASFPIAIILVGYGLRVDEKILASLNSNLRTSRLPGIA